MNQFLAFVKEQVKPYKLNPYFCYAVAMVESDGRGFMSNGHPLVRFEKHIMLRYAKKDSNSKILPRIEAISSTGYNAYQIALTIDSHLAMLSTSFGLYQIMGFNHEVVGYPTVEEFVSAMKESESKQIKAFCKFVEANNLESAINNADIVRFARAYNGAAYAKWGYDKKLIKAYNAIKPAEDK